ncbi:MAG: restriction endonuclease subunit S [Gammaproteobacteria bacterium]|nr:restriction endonuclease subunit S [Gammaproteobacteria bacterium]MCY4282023.1 restriction endonuclease subunit S [Gammaproteobacteria bacterium]
MSKERLIDLDAEQLNLLHSILKQHIPNKTVWAYGSRATWKAKETSDLDLAVFDCTPMEIYALKEALEESDLLISVDVMDWQSIPQSFKENIREKYVVVQEETRRPEGWREVRLGEVAEVNPRETIPKGTKAPKVLMDFLVPHTKRIPKCNLENYKGGSKFRNGDTLVARITPCLENGKTSFVDFLENDQVGFGSTEFIVLREKQDITDKHYLYYLAVSDDFRDVAVKSMTGTSGRQRVVTDEILRYKFFLPELPEQKAIAEVLSSLDDKIDLLHRQNKTLEAMAQALFRKWFVAEPKAYWQETPLDSIADYLNGLACQKFSPENETEKLPVLKIKELRGGFAEGSDWVTSTVDEKYIVHAGDVIFSWSGSLMLKIWPGQKCVLNQHLFKVTSDSYPKWFFFFWIKYHLNKFIKIADSKATTMGHIKRSDLSNSMVLIPDRQDLEKMNSKIEPKFEKIITNNAQIQNIENLREIFLPKLISGDVRLRVDHRL